MGKSKLGLLVVSAAFLIGTIVVVPKEGSVLDAILPGLVGSQIYRWLLPSLFLFLTIYFLFEVLKGRRR